MRVTFLAHDGFLIELDSVCLLFDWWKGALPPLPDKPLLVFVSHRHADHFQPEIFRLADKKSDLQFLLGSDLRLTPRNLEKWDLTPETAAKCRRWRQAGEICGGFWRDGGDAALHGRGRGVVRRSGGEIHFPRR